MSKHRTYVTEDFDYDVVCNWELGYRWFDNSVSRCDYPQMKGSEILDLCANSLDNRFELSSIFIWREDRWCGEVYR